MSYAYNNHRDYQLDHNNRRWAQINQNKWTDASHAQMRAINKAKGDWLRWGSRSGDPNGAAWLNMQIAGNAQPHGERMDRAHNDKMAAMQNYMANESIQVQDRMADMHENRISSKNNSDEMAANLKAQEIAAAERMNSLNANALGSMSNSLTSTVGGVGVSPEQTSMPSTNMFNREGERIGGSQYFKNSLLRS